MEPIRRAAIVEDDDDDPLPDIPTEKVRWFYFLKC